jgi:hypothetical protein
MFSVVIQKNVLCNYNEKICFKFFLHVKNKVFFNYEKSDNFSRIFFSVCMIFFICHLETVSSTNLVSHLVYLETS